MRFSLIFANGIIALVMFVGAATQSDFGLSDPSILRVISSIILISFVTGIWGWYKATGKYLDLFTAFLTSFTLFNAGQFLLYATGSITEQEVFGDGAVALQRIMTANIRLHAAYLICGSISAFLCGAFLMMGAGSKRPPTFAPVSPSSFFNTGSSQRDLRFLRFWGVFFLLISAVPFAITTFAEAQAMFFGGYAARYEQEVSFKNPLVILQMFFFPSLIYLTVYCHSIGRKSVGRNIIIACLLYSGFLFFLGNRGTGVLQIIAFTALWHIIYRPIGFRQLAIILIVFSILIAPIASIRNKGDRIAAFKEFFTDAQQNPIVSAVFEMGGSGQCVAAMTYLVPRERDFDFGLGYLSAAATVIPDLFTHGRNPFAVKAWYGMWLTETLNSGCGLGSSIVAEAYANFGNFAIMFFVFLGMGLAAVTSLCHQRRSVVYFAVHVILILVVPLWARSDFLRICRCAVFAIGVPLLSINMLFRLNPKVKRILHFGK